MSVHAPLERQLAEMYKAREVRKVVYFHCDHWEPWKTIKGGSAISEPNVVDVQHFVDATQKIDFARKLTLFYKPNLNHYVNPAVVPAGGVHTHADDPVYFPSRSDEQHDICRRAIRQVSQHTMHEFQVHVHHENFTFNHDHRSDVAIDFFSQPASRVHEEDRFALAVKLWLEAIEDETGKKLDRWFFVHGHWALNASDPTVCHIVREIEILQALGCLGDFTFPAGRDNVNPRLEVPYFARPVSEPKGYDLQQCDPQLAYGNKAAASERFFIWASQIKHGHASLDYYAPWLRERLDDTSMITQEIVKQSYCVDGTLFIKSHAHSMHPLYFKEGQMPVFPHADPAIATMFRTLFSAAGLAGADVEFLTASEVYDVFVNANYQPAQGRALTIPGEAADLSAISPPPRSQTGGHWHNPPRLVAAVTDARVPAVQSSAPAVGRAPMPAWVKVPPPALKDSELINARAINVINRRISELGEGPSGASSYYAGRAQQHKMLTSYELRLAQYFVADATKYSAYYEIGSGASTFPILLAANGMKAFGIEVDRLRYAAAVDVLQDIEGELARQSRALPAPCALLHGGVPQVLAALDLHDSVAVVMSLTTTITAQQRLDFIRGLLQFPVVILDAQRFITRQTSQAEETALVRELLEEGFSDAQLIVDLGADGKYYRLTGHGTRANADVASSRAAA